MTVNVIALPSISCWSFSARFTRALRAMRPFRAGYRREWERCIALDYDWP